MKKFFSRKSSPRSDAEVLVADASSTPTKASTEMTSPPPPSASASSPVIPPPSPMGPKRNLPIVLEDLPTLRDEVPTKREELFRRKLALCSTIFNFNDPESEVNNKDRKRQTLLELVDYVNTPAGQQIFTEAVMSDVVSMVKANLGRSLPPPTPDFDPEEDEPALEHSWPHLQVVYEFFLRFIVSGEVQAKVAKRHVDTKMCLILINLFDSEDPRERDYLKTILHRIYGKFMSHRSFIRKNISNVFYKFIYEDSKHNGIGELLEILGSIINGFAVPLKKEHLTFLSKALLPLHKPSTIQLYHQQLSYCVIQYCEKDPETGVTILRSLMSMWPWSASQKQVTLLNELEELLELLGYQQLEIIQSELYSFLARLIGSDHFQVTERTLFLWNNEHLVNSGCLSRQLAESILPYIYEALHSKTTHWNQTVEGLAQSVEKMYTEVDSTLFETIADECSKRKEERESNEARMLKSWAEITRR